MMCERTSPFAELCDDCKSKWIVQPDTLEEDPMYFCFNTEAEARKVFEHIEKYNEYCGIKFKPKSALLLHPKTEGGAENE